MSDEQVRIAINRREWVHWSEYSLKVSIDAYSTLEFAAPFEHERAEFRVAFRPASYIPVAVDVWGETVFDGVMIDVDPDFDASRSTVKASAYSTPMVFEDCTLPDASLPFEYHALTLRGIANLVCKPFDLRVYFPDEDGPVFEKVAAEKDQKIQDFLVGLAKQRGFVVTNTNDGALLIWKARAPGHPVARLTDEQAPVLGLTTERNTREYFTSITGYTEAKKGRPGGRFTVQNPRLSAPPRPFAVKFDDTETGDVATATRAWLGRMFANMVSYDVHVATWRDPSGQLWAPNTTITLLAPKAMIYTETELLIREVTFSQSANETTATLKVVLPGAFAGDAPERMPWDE